jgi:transposase
MNSHKNAHLTHHGRAELVHRVLVEGQTASHVAASFGVCVKTVRKWVVRFEAEGAAGHIPPYPPPGQTDRWAERKEGAPIDAPPMI